MWVCRWSGTTDTRSVLGSRHPSWQLPELRQSAQTAVVENFRSRVPKRLLFGTGIRTKVWNHWRRVVHNYVHGGRAPIFVEGVSQELLSSMECPSQQALRSSSVLAFESSLKPGFRKRPFAAHRLLRDPQDVRSLVYSESHKPSQHHYPRGATSFRWMSLRSKSLAPSVRRDSA